MTPDTQRRAMVRAAFLATVIDGQPCPRCRRPRHARVIRNAIAAALVTCPRCDTYRPEDDR